MYENTAHKEYDERLNSLRTAFSMERQDSGRYLRKKVDPQEAEASSITSINTSQGKLSIGTLIEHQRFGLGKIVKLEGTGENQKATVEFENSGSKQLLLKFARFTIVKS